MDMMQIAQIVNCFLLSREMGVGSIPGFECLTLLEVIADRINKINYFVNLVYPVKKKVYLR